jgi:hypothetical protein
MENKERYDASSQINRLVRPQWQNRVLVLGLTGALVLYATDIKRTRTWEESRSNSLLRIKMQNAEVTGKDSSALKLRTKAPFDFEGIVETHQLARAFRARPGITESVLTNTTIPGPSWCTHAYDKSAPTGLIYVKVHKTASSTTAGVAQRIADRVGQATSTSPCEVKYFHTHVLNAENKHYLPGSQGESHHLNQAVHFYGHRDQDRSFLFATIRDPTAHAISEVFFKAVTRNGMDPTDEKVIKKLQTLSSTASIDGYGGYQLAYTSMEELEKGEAWRQDSPTTVRDPALTIQRVKHVVEDYDFLIDVDRYDESLVALQLLLHLSPADIMYLPSKGPNAAYTRVPGKKCVPKTHSFISNKVQEYLDSDRWYAQGYGDFLFKAAVGKSLDMTIEDIGLDRFQNALSNFLKLKEEASTACLSKAVFPCGPNGENQMEASRTNCYKLDEGCGYPCLDKFFAQ